MKSQRTIFQKSYTAENDTTFTNGQNVYTDTPYRIIKAKKKEIREKETEKSIEEEEKLKQLTANSHHVLFKCSNMFPFDFFPDTLTIEPTQINIHRKTFFLTDHLLTIPIQNISDIHVQTSIFFASLLFVDRSFVENSVSLNWFRKEDAYTIRKIVQGLIIANNQNIDVEKIDTKTLKDQSEQLGRMHLIEA